MATVNRSPRLNKRVLLVSWPDRIISGVITLALFILPLFFFNFSWQGDNFDRFFILFLAVVIGWTTWLVKVITSGSLVWHWRKLDWLAVLLVLVTGLASFWSPSWRNSLFGSYGQPMRSLAFFVLLLLFSWLISNNWSDRLKKQSKIAILASFSFITIYSTLQLMGWFIIPLEFTKSTGFSPIGSLSNLALFLSAVLPLFILSVKPSDNSSDRGYRVWNIWMIVSAALAFINLVLLGYFTNWLVVILGLLIVLAFALSRIIKFNNQQLFFTAGLLIVSFVLLIIGNLSWLSVELPNEVSLSRSFSWQITKSSLSHRPILGTGLASFGPAFSRYKTADFNLATLWNLDFDLPSSWFMESLVVVGGLGTLLLMAYLLWSLFLAWRRLLSSDSKFLPEQISQGVGWLAAVMVLLVGGLLLSVNDSLLLIFGLLWILLMTSTYDWPRRAPEFTWRSPGQPINTAWTAGLIVVIIVLLSGTIMGGKLYLADYLASQSLRLPTIEQQMKKMSSAYNLAPWREMYGLSLAQLSWVKANDIFSQVDPQAESLEPEIQEQLQAYLQQSKLLLDQTYFLIKQQPAALKTIANLYEMIEDYGGAAMAHQQLSTIDTYGPWSYAKIAQLQVSQAYQAEEDEVKDELVANALKNYAIALELKPDWSDAYFYRAVLYQGIGDPVKATEDLSSAANYSGGAPEYLVSLAQLLNERSKDDEEEEDRDELREQAQGLLEEVFSQTNDLSVLYLLATIYRDSEQDELLKQAVDILLEVAENEEDQVLIRQEFADYITEE